MYAAKYLQNKYSCVTFRAHWTRTQSTACYIKTGREQNRFNLLISSLSVLLSQVERVSHLNVSPVIFEVLILILAVTRSVSVWGSVSPTCLSCWVDLDVFRLASSSNDLSPGSHFNFPSPNTLTPNCHLCIFFPLLPSATTAAITVPMHLYP